MPDTSFQECCHYDEQTFEVCSQPADYTTYYKGIQCAFCEKHYLVWIVLPLLDGTLEEALVSPVPPEREVAG
jgi:hypothetical protein